MNARLRSIAGCDRASPTASLIFSPRLAKISGWTPGRLSGLSPARAEPQSPQVFGAYYDVVLALEGDRLKDALQAAAQIVEERPTFTFRISKLQDRPTDELERTLRLLLGGPLPNMSKIFAAATPPFARTLG